MYKTATRYQETLRDLRALSAVLWQHETGDEKWARDGLLILCGRIARIYADEIDAIKHHRAA